MALSSNVDQDIIRGQSWEQFIDFFESDGTTPIDVSAHAFRFTVRKDKKAGTTEYDVTEAGGTEFSGIYPVPADSNRIKVTVPSSETDGWDFSSGVYELMRKDGNDIVTFPLRGKVMVTEKIVSAV